MPHAVIDRPTLTSSPGVVDVASPGAVLYNRTFAELGIASQAAVILAKRGVITPFPIQAATIPHALAGRDILGQGRTGSGKTLAFGLPLLQRLSGRTTAPKRPRGIVLAPTRELAVQIADALEPYANGFHLELKVVCGGTSMPRQIAALKRGVDILIATPGRLRDLIDRRACQLDAVEIAILDEADLMADMGFLPDMRELLNQMPATGQRMLFSATLDRGVDHLASEYLTDPARHSVDPSHGAVGTMTHHQILVGPRSKDRLAAIIAANQSRAIVFVRTQLGADRVAESMRSYGVNARALHGGMTQDIRTKTLTDLREGRIQVLIATDVAARGIDVAGVDLVLNADPASGATDYLHRAGRTARAGRSGVVATLVLPHQRRSVTRLLNDARVPVSEHQARGQFDAKLTKLTGLVSELELEKAIAKIAVCQAENEVAGLIQELEKARLKVEELRAIAEAPVVPVPEQRRAEDRAHGYRRNKPSHERTRQDGSRKKPKRTARHIRVEHP